MHVHVKAVQDDMPAGIMKKTLDVLGQAILITLKPASEGQSYY